LDIHLQRVTVYCLCFSFVAAVGGHVYFVILVSCFSDRCFINIQTSHWPFWPVRGMISPF